MTEVLLSPGALEQLPRVLTQYRCRHCLVVASGGARTSEILRRWTSNISGSYEVFSPDGNLPQISEAMRCHRERGDTFDAIVAIGGGRIIDTAKAISLRRKEIQSFFDDPSHELRAEGRMPIFAVPTLAGSGSEVTPFAVSYKDGIKHSLSHPALAPVAAIIDPWLMESVSYLQRAISGVDAIAHGVEALLSNRASDASDVYGMKAVETGRRILFDFQTGALDNLPELYEASIAGGRAIAMTRTTIPHAMSYFFTSVHGVPHGHAVGLTMGRYLGRFGASMKNDRRLWKWSRSYEFILDQFGASNYADIEEIWQNRLAKLGLGVSLSSLGITDVDPNELSRHVNVERFENSPLRLTVQQAVDLLVA